MPAFRNQVPLAIRDLLTCRSDRLFQLQQRAAELARIRQVLQQVLPVPLRDRFMVATFDPDTLVLIADGTAWAARLRFQIPALRSAARERCGLPGLKSVRIRVSPPAPRTPSAARKLRLSGGAAEFLRRSADSTTDEALRASLLRLSGHR
jgi:hypothetical protein